MLDQIYRIQSSTGERISNVVVMGSGEPLDNYDNLLRFIHLLTAEGGAASQSEESDCFRPAVLCRKCTSWRTKKLQMTLAVSLHASNDEKRQELMPIAKKYSIKELLKACRYYFEKTGRRITFEYSLVAGVNDTKEDALEHGRDSEGNELSCKPDPCQSCERAFFCAFRQGGGGEFQNKS